MVSLKAPVTVHVLFVICLLAANTSGVFYSCCRRYMTNKVPFSMIKGLSIQTDKEMCPMNAIIFHTRRGKGCFNPASEWVMDYVDRLRNKAQMVHIRTSKSQG